MRCWGIPGPPPARNAGPTSDRGKLMRVLVVDDYDLFRTGLARLLGVEPGIEVVVRLQPATRAFAPAGRGAAPRCSRADGSPNARPRWLRGHTRHSRAPAVRAGGRAQRLGRGGRRGCCHDRRVRAGSWSRTRRSKRWSWPYARRLRVRRGSRRAPPRSCCAGYAERPPNRMPMSCPSSRSRRARARGTAPGCPGNGEC